MQDAKRFLRYIFPGILFGVLTFILIWIALPELADEILKKYFFSKDSSISLVIGSILASGALGYFFATLHHWCHWHLCTDKNIINHTDQVKKLKAKGLLPHIVIKHSKPTFGIIYQVLIRCNLYRQSRKDRQRRLKALTTVSILWSERLDKKGKIGNSENRVSAFGDLAHAAGTARVASACSLIVTILLLFSNGIYNPTKSNVINYCLMLFIGVAVTFLFHDAYSRTGKISQQLYDNILEHALAEEFSNNENSQIYEEIHSNENTDNLENDR